jgi:hypothetical protein
MKNRNSVLHELDKIDGITSQMNFILKRGEPIESYLATIEKLKDSVNQIRLYIESEPISYR